VKYVPTQLNITVGESAERNSTGWTVTTYPS